MRQTIADIAKDTPQDIQKQVIDAQKQGISEEEFKEQFINKAQKTASWSDFTASLAVLGLGGDVYIASLIKVGGVDFLLKLG